MGAFKVGMKGLRAIFLLCKNNIFQENIQETNTTKREVKCIVINSELSIPNCKYDSTSYSPEKHFDLELSIEQHILIQKHIEI